MFIIASFLILFNINSFEIITDSNNLSEKIQMIRNQGNPQTNQNLPSRQRLKDPWGIRVDSRDDEIDSLYPDYDCVAEANKGVEINSDISFEEYFEACIRLTTTQRNFNVNNYILKTQHKQVDRTARLMYEYEYEDIRDGYFHNLRNNSIARDYQTDYYSKYYRNKQKIDSLNFEAQRDIVDRGNTEYIMNHSYYQMPNWRIFNNRY